MFECQLFLRVHTTYTRRLKENKKKQQRGRNDGEERHRSAVRHPPRRRRRRRHPLSRKQRAWCVIFEGSFQREKGSCCVGFTP